MKLSNVIISLFIAIILSGCATVGMKQSTCEKQYSAFEGIVNCTKKSFASDPRANNELIKLYFLKGDQLVEEVKEGKISETDAKVEWQTLYVQLKNMERANRPVQTHCFSFGNNINCTSY